MLFKSLNSKRNMFSFLLLTSLMGTYDVAFAMDDSDDNFPSELPPKKMWNKNTSEKTNNEKNVQHSSQTENKTNTHEQRGTKRSRPYDVPSDEEGSKGPDDARELLSKVHLGDPNLNEFLYVFDDNQPHREPPTLLMPQVLRISGDKFPEDTAGTEPTEPSAIEEITIAVEDSLIWSKESPNRKSQRPQDVEEDDDNEGVKSKKSRNNNKSGSYKHPHPELVHFLLTTKTKVNPKEVARRFTVDPNTVRNYQNDMDDEKIETLVQNKDVLALYADCTRREFDKLNYLHKLRKIGIMGYNAEFALALLKDKNNHGKMRDLESKQRVRSESISKLTKLLLDENNSNRKNSDLGRFCDVDPSTVGNYREHLDIDKINETANNPEVIAIYNESVLTYRPDTFIKELMKTHNITKRIAEFVLGRLNIINQPGKTAAIVAEDQQEVVDLKDEQNGKSLSEDVTDGKSQKLQDVEEDDDEELNPRELKKAHAQKSPDKFKFLHPELVHFLLTTDTKLNPREVARRFTVDPGTVINYQNDLKVEEIETLANDEGVKELYADCTRPKIYVTPFITALQKLGIKIYQARFVLALLNPGETIEEIERKDTKKPTRSVGKLVRLLLDPNNNMTVTDLAKFCKVDYNTASSYRKFLKLETLKEIAARADVISAYNDCNISYEPLIFVKALMKMKDINKRTAEFVLEKLNIMNQPVKTVANDAEEQNDIVDFADVENDAEAH